MVRASGGLLRCMFCGSDDMSEEHVIADWVFRAFTRSRRPGPLFRGSVQKEGELHLEAGEPIVTAKVVCRPCNNGWMSLLDDAAAEALKPLIRGRNAVTLTHDEQRAVAAWIFKSALVFDASQKGDGGLLVSSRGSFMESKSAPPGCTIYVGPAVPTSFDLDEVPEVAGLAIFGVHETQAPMNVSLSLRSADGEHVSEFVIPMPGYVVRLGSVQAIISGIRGPIVPTAEHAFSCVWPARQSPVTVTSVPP